MSCAGAGWTLNGLPETQRPPAAPRGRAEAVSQDGVLVKLARSKFELSGVVGGSVL